MKYCEINICSSPNWCLARSSANAKIRDCFASRSAMYKLENIGASTNPWSKPLFRFLTLLMFCPILTLINRSQSMLFTRWNNILHWNSFRHLFTNLSPTLCHMLQSDRCIQADVFTTTGFDYVVRFIIWLRRDLTPDCLILSLSLSRL